MSRSKRWAIRNALFQIEASIPKTRNQVNEWERDLIATANCAIWDRDTRKVVSCLRRLQASPARRGDYAKVMELIAA